jgi:hypothetical protein
VLVLTSSGCHVLLHLLQAWYPVAAVENLDPEKPNKCTLLGK